MPIASTGSWIAGTAESGRKDYQMQVCQRNGGADSKGAPMEGPHGKAAEGAAADSELLCKAAGG